MGYKISECAVIVGSKSRIGEAAYASIRKQYGAGVISMMQPDKPADLAAGIKHAAEQGAKVVAVGGGDGTIRLAAAACIEAGVVLGIIPAGTGNALAHEHNIPIDPIAAMELIIGDGVPKGIDVGYFNGQPFVTTATCGLSGDISKALKETPKGAIGRFAYLPAVVKAVREARPFRVELETDFDNYKGLALQLVVAASRTHAGPFPTTELAANDDGLLSIYVVEANNKHSMMRYGISLLFGKHTEQPHVWSIDTASVNVTLRKSQKFILDGDPFPARSAKLTVRKQQLTIIVPPAASP